MAGHGNPDQARAARYILNDYVDGKLLYCRPPPNCPEEVFQSSSIHHTSDSTSTEITPNITHAATTTTTKTTTVNEDNTDTDANDDLVIEEQFELEGGDSLKSVPTSMDRNPFTRPERGRKYQRRQKQKAQDEGVVGVYVAGKVKYGQRAHDPSNKLPTNVKLVSRGGSSRGRERGGGRQGTTNNNTTTL